ncbi:hypothetical protein F4604DRAFT_1937098 [Suillus subluteus]|nr:hypothetical protein F4604DRAFT_1937098 [Suillus subluteus]
MPLPFIRIEITGNTDERGEEIAGHGVSDVNGDEDCQKQAHLLPERDQETSESIAELKERLQHAEEGCLRLEELYRKYRIRWLEENYQASVLEKYALCGIDICSPRQLTWDSPSPIQSDNEDE